nr:DUF2711 family protein [uncultured Rhodoferax sp.]
MTKRVLPAPDLYAVCPNGGPVLPFYQGNFEAAYVLLHPFLRPTPTSLENSCNDAPLDRAAIQARYEPVFWSEVQRVTGFRSISEVDIALRTQIGGLREEFANKSLATRLRFGCEQAGIVEPSEGTFSDLSHNSVLSFIQEQGYEWVWVGDEFCTERKLHWIDELKEPTSKTTEGHCSLFTPDKSILWTTHWDSHFSFFCGTKETIEKLASDQRFEGFECLPDTEVYWSLR